MSAQWLSAGDALRTDWSEADPRDRDRQASDAEAEFVCGVLTNLGQGGMAPCPERFFTRDARDVHYTADHLGLVDLERYSRPTGRDDPMFSDFGTVDKRKALQERPGDRPRRSLQRNNIGGV